MKYSLDLTNPWITKYYDSSARDQELQTGGSGNIDYFPRRRDLYKFWLADDELSHPMLLNRKDSWLDEFGYVKFSYLKLYVFLLHI